MYPRILNDVELGRQAKEMGMRAIVVKNHFVATADRAQIATEESSFPVYGGIALNHSVGGMNPHAVDISIKLGGKIIWLPTLHARAFISKKDHVKNLAGQLGEGLEGLYLLDDQGELKPEVLPVLDLIAKANVILATGHVSIPEAKTVVREAVKRGVKKIVVTHPLASFVAYTLDDMKEILDLGATWLEHVYNDTTRQVGHPIKVKDLYDAIKAIGPEHCILSTDAGQWLNPVPAQQMGIYIKDMLNLGLTGQDIRTMVADNPAHALGV
jgi:hypothetical protein